MNRPQVSEAAPHAGAGDGRHRRNLFTPALKGKIVRELKSAGVWTGTRKGIGLQFSRQAGLFEAERPIEWRARIGGRWNQGNAGTVFDACQAIESL